MAEKISVVCAANTEYLVHATTMLASLFATNVHSFDVYFLYNNEEVGEESLALLDVFVRRNGHRCIVKPIDLSALSSLLVNSYISVEAYFRLLLPEMLPTPDKVLYLDADIIIQGDISKLWKTQLGDGNYLGAVRDPNINPAVLTKLGLGENDPYFNSGVLLLNLKKMREDHVQEKLLTFARCSQDKITCHDQCVLNYIVKGHWKALSPKWNMQTGFFLKNVYCSLSEEVKKEVLFDPVIVHFNYGLGRPWEIWCAHPYRHLYRKYKNRQL